MGDDDSLGGSTSAYNVKARAGNSRGTRTTIVPLLFAFPLVLLLLMIHPSPCMAFSGPTTTAAAGVMIPVRRTTTTSTTRPRYQSLPQTLNANNNNNNDDDEQERLKGELFRLLDATPANAPTPRDLTNSLLGVIQQLEQSGCPTENENVVTKLGGTWELLWTTQDRSSNEFKDRGPFRNWINPLENQSYSNNPDGGSNSGGAEGRLNPVLPRPVQDQLERMGIIRQRKDDADNNDVRSSQTIDLRKGRVRNLVTFGIPSPPLAIFDGNDSPTKPRRASLTVDVDFTPDPTNPRRINVKFQSCRVTVPQSPLNVRFPLGLLGPTGWLQTNYIDDQIRITRGHKGSVFVLQRPTKTPTTTTSSSSSRTSLAS